MQVRTNLDFLKQSEIQNVILHRVSSFPTSPINGMIVFRTDEQKIYVRQNNNWISLGQIGLAVDGALDENFVSGIQTLSVRVDDATIEVNGLNRLEIKNGGVTNAKLDKSNIPLSGFGAPTTEINLNNHRIINLSNPVNDQDAATKIWTENQISAQIASLGALVGSHDASTGNFPTSGSGIAGEIRKGDYWKINVAGTIDGIVLEIGDTIFAKINNATQSANDWFALQANVDQATENALGTVRLATNAEVQTGSNNQKVVTPASLSSRTATETRTGILAVGTQSEVDAGTLDNVIVTPLKLNNYINTALNSFVFSTNIGNGTNTTINIVHNLNSEDVDVFTRLAAGNKEKVLTTVRIVDSNEVSLLFSNPPALEELRVKVSKV